MWFDNAGRYNHIQNVDINTLLKNDLTLCQDLRSPVYPLLWRYTIRLEYTKIEFHMCYVDIWRRLHVLWRPHTLLVSSNSLYLVIWRLHVLWQPHVICHHIQSICVMSSYDGYMCTLWRPHVLCRQYVLWSLQHCIMTYTTCYDSLMCYVII